MKKIIEYRNNFGDTIRQEVEVFDIRGTIMTARVVANVMQGGRSFVAHRLWVEDSKGGYSVSIWNTAKGYDYGKLKSGDSARFKGIVMENHYYDSQDNLKTYREYKAQEMS